MSKLKPGNFLLHSMVFCLGSIPAVCVAATDPGAVSTGTILTAPTEISASPAGVSSSSDTASLPDSPEPTAQTYPVSPTGNQVPPKGSAVAERFLNAVDPGYLQVGDKWDVTINKGEKVRPYTKRDKLQYALEEELSPFTVFDAAWSAGYEHLRDANPHFGSDSAGYGERFGAAMFRQGTYRLFGDGILPALLHEDPRYYRVADGSLLHRGTQSILQVIVSHRDDGTRGVNYATLGGEVISNSLPLTFYPQNSVKFSVAAEGVGTSLLADAGFKLFREFIPDLFRAANLIPQGK